ncbi:hypothetical protein D5086_029512 [Populus alba]|uniref:Uncharacterized protein n=1 Tax=Populus alba TaxID=43335 RepID=A0ACC4ATQ9_POPAL
MIQTSLSHQIKYSLVDSMGWDKMLIGSLFGSPIPRTGLCIYWPNPDFDVFGNGRTNYNSSRTAVFDEMGHFISSDHLQFSAPDTDPKCSCPPGYEITEPGNWNKGCKPMFNSTLSQSQQVKFVLLPHVDYWGFDLNFSASTTFDSCMKLCLGIIGSAESETTIGSPSMYNFNTKRTRWVYFYSFASAIGFIEILFVVFSYGVVALEIVKGIPLSNWVIEDREEHDESNLTRFVRVVKRKIQCGETSWIEEVVDPRLNGQFSRSQATTIVELGMSCVEEDRNMRPTMDSVVQALLECLDES